MTTTEILRARMENKPGVVGATIVTRTGRYFDFVDPLPDQIDAVDTEQRDLTAGRAESWNGLDAYLPLPEVIVPEAPDVAAGRWLQRFQDLGGAW